MGEFEVSYWDRGALLVVVIRGASFVDVEQAFMREHPGGSLWIMENLALRPKPRGFEVNGR